MRVYVGLHVRLEVPKESIMTRESRLKFAFVLIAAAVCAGVLVLTATLTNNGWLIFLPYIALSLIAVLYLRSRHVQSFAQRFVLPFGASALATVFIDVYLITVANPRRIHTLTPSRVLGPLLVALFICAIGSSIVAVLSRPPNARDGLRNARVGTESKTGSRANSL